MDACDFGSILTGTCGMQMTSFPHSTPAAAAGPVAALLATGKQVPNTPALPPHPPTLR